MSLQRAYRATCDAPGCSAAVMLPHDRTEACREQLAELGWSSIPHRVRDNGPGAPRLIYMCPEHRDVRPPGWREARAAVVRHRVQRGRQIRLDNVSAPTVHLESARRAAVAWMLAEAVGSKAAVARAFGVSSQRLHQIVRDYEAALQRRHASAEGWVEPWAKRLRAAGAIP